MTTALQTPFLTFHLFFLFQHLYGATQLLQWVPLVITFNLRADITIIEKSYLSILLYLPSTDFYQIAHGISSYKVLLILLQLF